VRGPHVAVGDRVLVTGANGFVGTALCRRLREDEFLVRMAGRARSRLPGGISDCSDCEWVVLHDRSNEAEITQALDGVGCIIHLAARVHVMTDHAADPLAEFRSVNANWTERLARAAASQGVRRFVYLSSIKVNGEQSLLPFTEQDPPNPQDPYGVSKWEAEQALARVSSKTGMETVVVRSPLVYGPGVGGNFLQLLNILRRGVPLPLALVRNRRSLVYRGNLVDALTRCVRDVRAAGQTYLVSDGEDLSTPELIRRLGKALGQTVHLWPLSLLVLGWLGRLVGRQAMIGRLIGSLQVNSSKIRQELEWSPPFSVDRGLAETAAWYCARSLRLHPGS